MKHSLILTFVLFNVFTITAGNTPVSKPPVWAKYAIWYQIFPERFNNGDKANDPKPEDTEVADMKIFPPAGWTITPWTSNWFEQDMWMKCQNKNFSDMLQYRRYGGDLQGVLDKLNYLENLGINAIYINPINDAPSLHKYDARNYHHIDINFGPDPEGDKRIIASEDPANPDTWQWTSADKLFLKLIDECHKRNIRIIMDYSWNHTGTLFWAWQDVIKNQAASAYKSWYNITSFDQPDTPENEFSYEGWYGNAYMPELRKTDIKTPRINGKPYEGDMDEGVKKHVFAVSARWLAPDGDSSRGVDGYRLDVAEQIGLEFWRQYRSFVRSVKEDAYLIGEIWWEKWPDKLMNPVPYLQGDIFDAVMYYQVYKPARYFFAKTDYETDAAQLKDSLLYQWNSISRDNLQAMMNVSSSHDAPRLLTDFANRNKYKYHANPNENPEYITGKPDKDSYIRLKLYLTHLFTIPGAPQIWNGEEMGMWGADDPFGRKPLWWKELKFKPENRNNIAKNKPEGFDKTGFDNSMFTYYQKLINIRKNNPVLSSGDITFLIAQGKKLAYKRFDAQDEIIAAFNLETTQQTFDLPEGRYTDLITGTKFNGKAVTLKSMQAAILKRL